MAVIATWALILVTGCICAAVYYRGKNLAIKAQIVLLHKKVERLEAENFNLENKNRELKAELSKADGWSDY